MPFRQMEGFLTKLSEWIKVHIAADIKNKVTLGIEITDETVTDSEKFEALSSKNIESGIKTRINASTRSRGSPYRAKCVRKRKEPGGYKGWRDKYEYGKRWLAESIFSSVKRIAYNLKNLMNVGVRECWDAEDLFNIAIVYILSSSNCIHN